ncbi:MAG: hypothetical protein CMJ58_09385 [Planctomycetaceae bacterium]|nr:hypothetical protein [Planctomycetaceae bacterium]
MLIAIGTSGCGPSSGLSYAPAEGVVLIDGEPAERVEVVFTLQNAPATGAKPSARAVTDAQGRFALRTLTPEKDVVEGAAVGTHQVTVRTQVVEQDELGNARVVRQETLGRKYTEGGALSVEIPNGGATDLKLEASTR